MVDQVLVDDAASRIFAHARRTEDVRFCFVWLKDRNYKFTMKGYSLFGINSAKSGKVHQLVTAYLLSSDFFQNKMDEKRTIKYVGLYDPYSRPCSHPFSHIHYA